MDLFLHKKVLEVLPPNATNKVVVATTLGYMSGFKSKNKSLASKGKTVSYTEMANDKISFARFVKAAAGSTTSPEYIALYKFLLKCFTDADKDFNGRIDAEEFDHLVEKAATAPRLFGYAPSTTTMYENDELKRSARKKMFTAMDEENKGSLGFEPWLAYCYDHIRHKAATLEINPSDTAISRNKETYINYMKKAIIKPSPEYKELYLFLLKCFTEADANMDGRIGPYEFDLLIETASATPRQFSLAPTTEEMYASTEERTRTRQEIFKEMDGNKDGFISFDEWLKFSFAHIYEKVKELD